MPMRNSMRLSAATPVSRSGIACCTATAQRTASTTLANSTSIPSQVVLTTRDQECQGGTRPGDAPDQERQSMVFRALSSRAASARDGGLIVARVMPLRLHGSIARLLLPGRSEASIERPGDVEG